MSEESDGGKRPRGRGLSRVDREEQGDLLAEAVTGFFSFGRKAESKEDPDADHEGEGSLVPEAHKPGAVEESDTFQLRSESDRNDGDEEASSVEAIPESAWEQKMAWAKERAAAGRQEEALELYQELVQEDPVNVRALNNLGVLQDEMGDAEGAVATLRAAKKIQPTNQEILGNLGAALGTLGRYKDAEKELRNAFRLDPSNLQVRANLGILLYRRGLYEQAVAELKVVCKALPEDAPPLFYMGEALNRLGRVDEAIQALTRFAELSPGNSKAYYTLGVLFDKKSLPEEASEMYKRARELNTQ